jgi:hypothetical protein
MESHRCKNKEEKNKALSAAWLLSDYLTRTLEVPHSPYRIKCKDLVVSNGTKALNSLHAGCEIHLPELHYSS